MTGYWVKHRALYSVIVSVAIAAISVLLFVFPFVLQMADNYNSQSIYKNTLIDFIAPEPSFEQINGLPGSNGIEKVFPFFMTKVSVNANGKSRTTTVILSDRIENIDISMYNDKRIVRKSNLDYDNPIIVDWQFCKDTLTDIGDIVSFSIGDVNAEYKIYAIYETNSIYENGAIFLQIDNEQKERIVQKSQNNGYSGMYIKASDYNACRTYLTKDYRPLGRLKERERFESDEQYQMHYDAIMESGYANEITDFRIRENSLDKNVSTWIIWIGTILSAMVILGFNVFMARRKSEKGYFLKYCIPKGQNVKPYYTKTFICELLTFMLAYFIILFFKLSTSATYIHKNVFGIEILFIPAIVLGVEIISLCLNKSMIKRKNKIKRSESRK